MSQNAQPINIVLVDDHPIIRSGLRELLTSEPDCPIAGEASDGLAVLRPVEQSRPDEVIADVTMAGLNGLDMTMKLTNDFLTSRSSCCRCTPRKPSSPKPGATAPTAM